MHSKVLDEYCSKIHPILADMNHAENDGFYCTKENFCLVRAHLKKDFFGEPSTPTT